MVLTFQYLKKVIIISSLGKLTFVFPFPRAMFVKFGIIKKLMLRVYKKLFYSDFLMGKSFGKSFCWWESCRFKWNTNETLRKLYSKKKVKCNYWQPPWQNDKIKKCLRKRWKLSKCYYKHGQKKEDQEKLPAKTAFCTEEILKTKSDYILRMTNRLNDPKAAPETYKKIPSKGRYRYISPYLLTVNLFQTFV